MISASQLNMLLDTTPISLFQSIEKFLSSFKESMGFQVGFWDLDVQGLDFFSIMILIFVGEHTLTQMKIPLPQNFCFILYFLLLLPG